MTCSVGTPLRRSHTAGLFESTVPVSVNSGADTSVAVGIRAAGAEESWLRAAVAYTTSRTAAMALERANGAGMYRREDESKV
jgi:hypothetical protein